MLKDGVVLLVLGVIAAGGVFVWWTQGPTQSPGTLQPQVQESAQKTVSAAAKTTPIHKPVLAPVAEPPALAVDVPSPEVAVATPLVQLPPPLFPGVEQIATGVREDTITGKFGGPALSALTSTGGHVVETFVYARDRGRLATVIRLEDGKVSAAYSQSEPPTPTGLSAPRR